MTSIMLFSILTPLFTFLFINWLLQPVYVQEQGFIKYIKTNSGVHAAIIVACIGLLIIILRLCAAVDDYTILAVLILRIDKTKWRDIDWSSIPRIKSVEEVVQPSQVTVRVILNTRNSKVQDIIQDQFEQDEVIGIGPAYDEQFTHLYRSGGDWSVKTKIDEP